MRAGSGGGAFLLAIGMVIGMVAAGVALPLAVGERVVGTSDEQATAFGGADVADGPGPEDGTPGADGTGVGAGTGPGGAEARTDRGPGGARRGTGAGPGGGADDDGRPGGSTTLRATDRGVTAEAIKVGVFIGEVGGAGQAGIDLGEFNATREREAWQGYIKDINDRGGINGRRVEAVYEIVDVLRPGAAEAACANLTNTHKVFAVLNMGFLWGPPILCFTEQNRTPLIKGDPSSGDEYFRRSRGYLSSSVASYDRITRNLGSEAHHAGLLQGKRIGIVWGEDYRHLGQSTKKGLADLGYSVAHETEISSTAGEAQIPTEVTRMNGRVDVVFLVATTLTHSQWVNAADRQGFRPQYIVSEMFGGAEDVTARDRMPPSWEGTVAFTMVRSGEWRLNLPEPPADKACRETYERTTGRKLATSNDDPRYVILVTCDVAQRFEAAAKSAGPNLTRDGLVAAITRLGDRPTPYTGGGSYGPGKTDAADYFRTKRWENACQCYRIQTVEFRKARMP